MTDVRGLLLTLAATLALAAQTFGIARADGVPHDSSLEVEQVVAMGLGEEDVSQLRTALRPSTRIRFSSRWSARLDARLEYAGSDTGLGSTVTYSDLASPWEIGSNFRLELGEAKVSRRGRGNRLTIGKQSFAWGILDGIQVTDRLDAVRRREAVFTPQRPERIPRWGVRFEQKAGPVRLDFAAVLDRTADQLPESDRYFALSAPRFRAGLRSDAPQPPISGMNFDGSTFGLRAQTRLGRGDLGFVMLYGPDTEPVFRLRNDGVELNYLERTLVGATWQQDWGSSLWRVELAHVPNQPVNVESPVTGIDRRERWLAGVGMDLDLPGGVFLNAQLGIDHLRGSNLVRPNTDVLATVRARRSMANDRWQAELEVLSELNRGDGVLRPMLSYQGFDHLRIDLGADLIWGSRNGIFGQYDAQDRLWLRTTLRY
ncbi:MAG: hypothetical protein AAGA23_08300 [Pseudomonadota bacterium]